MNIAYPYGDCLYLNITNRCPCSCTFCIRLENDGVGGGENLWLDRDPSLEDVIRDIAAHNLADYREVVFCGYGEPTERLDVLLDVCRYLKSCPDAPPIRLNTNGLSDLINSKETAPLLEGLVDIVSVSLNAPTAALYQEVVRPTFGERSFDSMLRFAAACKRFVPKVWFSVVDVISPEAIGQCQSLADTMHIPLRVRAKS